MLPSLFFFPAIPEILEELNSIAAMKSVVAITILFTILLFTVYCLLRGNYSLFVQIIWLPNSTLIREYLFQPTLFKPFS